MLVGTPFPSEFISKGQNYQSGQLLGKALQSMCTAQGQARIWVSPRQTYFCLRIGSGTKEMLAALAVLPKVPL